jgi:hypothetical protein
VQCAGELVVEDVLDERALAAAGDAGDADEGAERNVDGDVFEVVVAGADDAERGAVERRTGDAIAGFMVPRGAYSLIMSLTVMPPGIIGSTCS